MDENLVPFKDNFYKECNTIILNVTLVHSLNKSTY